MTARSASSRRGSAAQSHIAVDVARDGVTVPLSADRVKAIVHTVCKREKISQAMISVTFISNRAMARMNREHLGHRGATDIITFELAPANGVTVGDIYIAPDVARTNARTHGVGVREELTRLVVHGTLHVLGYTHPDDETRTGSPMWHAQEKLVVSLA